MASEQQITYLKPRIAPFVEIDYQMIDRHKEFSIDVDDDILNVALERPCTYNVTGCIVKIHEDYIILYAPIEKIWKVLVKKDLILQSPFIKAVRKLELGQWMTIDAVPRLSQAYDNEVPIRYSHFGISKPEHFDIKLLVRDWEQRFVDGVYQVLVSVTMQNEEICFEDYGTENETIYHLITTDQAIKVIVPAYRLAPIYANERYPETVLRFWVNRGKFVSNYCMHLFEQNQIDQFWPDGTVLIHVSPLIYQDEYNRAVEMLNRDKCKTDDLSSYSHDTPQDSLTEELDQAEKQNINESSPCSSAGFNFNIAAVSPERSSDSVDIIDALQFLNNAIIKEVVREQGLTDAYNIVTNKLPQIIENLKMSNC